MGSDDEIGSSSDEMEYDGLKKRLAEVLAAIEAEDTPERLLRIAKELQAKLLERERAGKRH
jgi:hypothetical protein